jgi:hypothetical protein
MPSAKPRLSRSRTSARTPERLVLTMAADVVEDLANRPLGADRDVGRRHETANRLFGVAEERARD